MIYIPVIDECIHHIGGDKMGEKYTEHELEIIGKLMDLCEDCAATFHVHDMT